jgi:hypothetical protein
MAKVAKNLTLDPEVVEKAREYAARHDKSLSELVGELLESVIRRDAGGTPLSPAVSRLMGVGTLSPAESEEPMGVDAYHAYLEKKHTR